MKIYKLIKNDKAVYIGQTNQQYLTSRASQHKYRGKDFDSIELIEETDDLTREAYWVDYYDTFNNGCNCSTDGKTIAGLGTGNKNPNMKNMHKATKKRIRIYNNTFSEIFESVTEGCKQLNLNIGAISAIARGVNNYKHKGYKAEYIKENE